ncbi:MAG: hypothetical protein AAF519_06810 [Bacteroidota bacterium]
MASDSVRFIGLLGVLFAIYLILFYILNLFFPFSNLKYASLIVGVVFVITVGGYLAQVLLFKKVPDYSIHIILIALVVRLVVFGAFIFMMIYFNRSLATQNAVIFFVSYLGFTLAELIALSKKIKPSEAESN